MITSSARLRSGVTLFGLLVLLSVFGLLLALLFPALARVRQASDKIKCANNLRQLGIAVHNYASNRAKVPPAVIIPYAESALDWELPNTVDMAEPAAIVVGDDRMAFGPNWAVFLLPYIEQIGLYQQANVKSYPGPNATKPNDFKEQAKFDLSWRQVRTARLKVFECPEDRGHETFFSAEIKGAKGDEPQFGVHPGKNWARSNYAANAGPAQFHLSVGGKSPEIQGFGRAGGVMTINWGVKLGELTTEDGTSNTIMLNEVRVGVEARDRRGVWAMGLPGCSITAGHATPHCVRPNDKDELSDGIQDCALFNSKEKSLAQSGMGCDYQSLWSPPMLRNLPNTRAQARSRHAGGVNAAFADGSIRFVRDNVDPKVWFYMNSRNDGKTYRYE